MEDIYTQENINKVVKLYNQGLSLKAVQVEVGLGFKAVKKILKMSGIEIRKNQRITIYDLLSEDEINNVVKLYLDGNSQDTIKNICGISKKSIVKILKDRNIEIRKTKAIKKLSNEDIEEMCKLYNEGKTTTQLADMFNINCSYVWYLLNKSNVELRPCGTRYLCDDYYFDNIDTEDKAYILGLLYADGTNDTKRHRIMIGLQERDKEILDIIKEKMKIKNPLSYLKIDIANRSNIYRLHVISKHMSSTLNNLGMCANKSLILEFPEWLNESLYPHFIRGYFDGDGYVSSEKWQYNCSIVSTYNFCKKVSEILSKELNINCTIYDGLHNGVTRTLSIHNKADAIKFLNYIYTDATIFLQRKYDVYKSRYINIDNTLSA